MGLDWLVSARPKAGHEEEYQQLWAEMTDDNGERNEQGVARFQEITIPAYTDIGAPRVGIDAAADEWLQGLMRDNGDDRPLAEIVQQMHGYYAVEALPDCDGFPVYSNGGLYDGVDRTSFRGKFLSDCEDILGDELLNRAWEHLQANELLAYGQALQSIAEQYAAENNVEHVLVLRDISDEDYANEPAAKAHFMISAAKWCIYWAERGFGLEPYF